MRQPAVCEMQRIRKRGSLVPERGNRFFGRIPIDDPLISARRPYPEHGLLDGLWSCHHVPRFTVKKCTPARCKKRSRLAAAAPAPASPFADMNGKEVG